MQPGASACKGVVPPRIVRCRWTSHATQHDVFGQRRIASLFNPRDHRSMLEARGTS